MSGNNGKSQTVSSLEQIKSSIEERNTPEVVEFPSGMVLKMRRPSITQLLKEKKIPQPLISAALGMAGKEKGFVKTDIASENVKLSEYLLFVSIVEPEGITEEMVENFSDLDKEYSFSWIQKGVEQLKSFRSVKGSPDVRPDTEKVSDDKTKPDTRA